MFTFPALRNMDPRLEEAADVSGASAQGWGESSRNPSRSSATGWTSLRFFKAEMQPASNVKAGGEIRMRQATAILGLTLFAALAMIAATASGFEI
jgi:hypothetical protein